MPSTPVISSTEILLFQKFFYIQVTDIFSILFTPKENNDNIAFAFSSSFSISLSQDETTALVSNNEDSDNTLSHKHCWTIARKLDKVSQKKRPKFWRAQGFKCQCNKNRWTGTTTYTTFPFPRYFG
jgi:hypothetical protein